MDIAFINPIAYISPEGLGIHLRFVQNGELPPGAYKGSYDHLLVLVSYLFAVFASYVGLITTSVIRDTRGASRFLWQTLGIFALGGGIWSMHFTGMTAYVLPVPVSYDVLLTALSTVPAFFASALVLACFGQAEKKKCRSARAGLMLAAGIGSMHFIGMEAMQSRHGMLYDPYLFALSLLVAVVLAFAALFAEGWLREYSSLRSHARLAVTAALVGLAITGMHYTAMTAVYHVPGESHGGSVFSIGSEILSASMNGFVFILLLTVTSVILIKKMLENAALFQNVFNSSTDALLVIQKHGRILKCNDQAADLFGLSSAQLHKRNIFALIPALRSLSPDDIAAIGQPQETVLQSEKATTTRWKCG